jgi:hypothetical protein
MTQEKDNMPSADDCRFSILDFPPGPRDTSRMYALFWDAVEDGLIEPLHEFRRGQRLFRGADPEKSTRLTGSAERGGRLDER